MPAEVRGNGSAGGEKGDEELFGEQEIRENFGHASTMLTLHRDRQACNLHLMEARFKTIFGYMYASSNEQFVIDEHPSDTTHLTAAPLRDVPPIHTCRTYLRELIPSEWCDRQAMYLVSREVDDAGNVVAVKISFTPQASSSVEAPLPSQEDLPGASSR